MKLAKDLKLLHSRIRFFRFVLFSCFLLTAYGYFRVQIVHNTHYETLGQKYRIKKLPLSAERGLFYSREGTLLVENQPTYSLVLHRDELKAPWKKACPEIAEFLNIEAEILNENYKMHQGRYLGLPIPLIRDLSFSEALRIKRQKKRFPFLEVEAVSQRHHKRSHLYSHILGYVGLVTPKQLKENDSLKPGDLVGRTGLESKYNDFMLGKSGEKTIHIDSKGLIHHVEISKPAVPGSELVLSLSSELQEQTHQIMSGQVGVALLMDVKSGEILSYFSAPAFDLNSFTGGISQKKWDELTNSKLKPLFNRPIQGTYAPGSTFKLVSAITALKTGKVSPSTRINCAGSISFLGREFHCHKRGGHGWINLSDALKMSCNVYMYQLAKDIPADEYAKVAKEMGLGVRTGIDIPGEVAGIVPSPDWKKKKYNKIWFPGETLSLSIGQGDLQITPIQMLRLMAIIANDGIAINPHFLKSFSTKGQQHASQAEVFAVKDISPSFFRLIKHAMWRTINEDFGTGSQAQIPGFDVCGKTGTAQKITFRSDDERKEKRYQNAWFTGFAPYKNPEVAVVVLVESAGHGGEAAAPIARKILEAYMRSPVRDQILASF